MDPAEPFDDDDEPHTILSTGMRKGLGPQSEEVGHYLVLLEGDEPGKLVELGAEPLTIGRDARQKLVFATDTELSRLHARVSLLSGRVVAEDMGSTNGTFVNARRITEPVPLPEGSLLHLGRQVLKYERRSRRDVERARELARDLAKASRSVLSMLPPPIDEGPVRTRWHFLPSAQLGGDAFGYYWLDSGTFVFYLMDVSGHGVGSAMHSVSVLNVLPQRALPDVDFAHPAEVLTSLNERYQMDGHNGMYFTIWYGVYRTDGRTLTSDRSPRHAGSRRARDPFRVLKGRNRVTLVVPAR